jgi:imidazolonepropionase-like amidohydrolase
VRTIREKTEATTILMPGGRISAVGKQGDVSSIALGRFGDLVGVAGNPLDDVKLLEKISFVMKDGELVRAPGSQRP